MTIEAMKQALEALELMYACYAHPEWISHKQQEEKILAQCVATTMTLRQALVKQEQGEPVAFVIDRFQGQNTGSTMAEPQVIWIGNVKIGDKLYTTPQQRKWVGLTQEDKEKLWADTGNVVGCGGLTFENISAIEAKLKEKNT